MYIVKNALIAIKRNKGRNILIGVILMVIACFLTVTLAIKNTSTSLIKSYEEASEVVASLTFNRENMMDRFNPENEENFEDMKEEFDNIEPLSSEDIKSYADSKYVTSYYYTSSISIDSDMEATSNDFSFGGRENRNNNENMKEENIMGDFTLMGYSNSKSLSEFITGTYTLSDYDTDIWNKILDGNYALINSELATLNGISINDEITVIDTNNSDNTLTLTVVGIFKDNEENNENGMSLFSRSSNTIITNTKVLDTLVSNNNELQVNITPYFTLTSLDDKEAFASELSEKGLNENYQVTVNEDEITSATSLVSNVKTFANTFMIITFIIGGIVLFVLTSINIRERKYEIGVLRTIGMKKSKIAYQFMLELVVVALVSLLLGATIGASISKPVSNSLLESEINKSTENIESIKDNFGGDRENRPNMDNFNLNEMSGIANVQAIDKVDAVVDFKVIGELLGLSLVLILISSIASIMSIVRFRPLDILKERS